MVNVARWNGYRVDARNDQARTATLAVPWGWWDWGWFITVAVVPDDNPSAGRICLWVEGRAGGSLHFGRKRLLKKLEAGVLNPPWRNGKRRNHQGNHRPAGLHGAGSLTRAGGAVDCSTQADALPTLCQCWTTQRQRACCAARPQRRTPGDNRPTRVYNVRRCVRVFCPRTKRGGITCAVQLHHECMGVSCWGWP